MEERDFNGHGRRDARAKPNDSVNGAMDERRVWKSTHAQALNNTHSCLKFRIDEKSC